MADGALEYMLSNKQPLTSARSQMEMPLMEFMLQVAYAELKSERRANK